MSMGIRHKDSDLCWRFQLTTKLDGSGHSFLIPQHRLMAREEQDSYFGEELIGHQTVLWSELHLRHSTLDLFRVPQAALDNGHLLWLIREIFPPRPPLAPRLLRRF